jgi:UDP-GlcNAc:undecaprenyl-phosphate GlcNAc-1-phosphate transferase
MSVDFINLPSNFWWFLFFTYFLNFFISLILSKLSLNLALKWGILDNPKTNLHRKKQKEAVPLLGASGFILSSTFLMAFVWLLIKDFFNNLPIFGDYFFEIKEFLVNNLEPFKIIWIFLSLLILFVAGFLDDKFQFSSKIMILPIFLAIFATVFFGEISINSLSAPFSNFLPQNLFLQNMLAVFWLLICISATKFLDGLDGLVSSLGIIALGSISLISLILNVNQPFVFLIAMIWMAGILGFLPYNYPNAKVYLGEGGSLIIGYLIGVLSIISGAKIATTSSVIGWFVYDIIFVMSLRLWQKKNPLEGDRKHWHFRLQDLGIKKWQVLWLTNCLVLITAFFGVILPTTFKPYLLILQAVILLFIFALTEFIQKSKIIDKKK